MNVIKAAGKAILFIGRQGETRHRQVLFDFSDIANEFPGGTITLLHRPPGQEESYPVEQIVIDYDNFTALWTIMNYDTATEGTGECQLIYTVDGISKTKIYKTVVDRSFTITPAQVPTWEDISESLLIAAHEVQEAIKGYDELTARAEILEPDAEPTAEIDRTGENPVLVIGIPDVSQKADKKDTVLLTTLSRGRAEGSTVGEGSIAFGAGTTASGNNSRAIGAGTQATGFASSAEGSGSRATGDNSHAEGAGTEASANQAHSEGSGTKATNQHAHAEGNNTIASGNSSHSEGAGTTASGDKAHSEGSGTLAGAAYSHSEGLGTKAQGPGSHSEGQGTETTASAAHSEGEGSKASGQASHSEGSGTKATGSYSHAENAGTTASGSSAHSEGAGTVASGMNSHAEGAYTVANSENMHSQGVYNKPNDPNTFRVIRQWHGGDDYKIGDIVHRGDKVYVCKIPNSDGSFSSSKWYWLSDGEKAFVIGNGSSDYRHDAFAVLWDGTLVLDEEAYLTKENVIDLQYRILRDEYIPDTTQNYTFNADDFVVKIEHVNGDGVVIREDTFEYYDHSIIEQRTLMASGMCLTIETLLDGYTTTVSQDFRTE